jgi:2-polyprenyl-3-methyl-5-hydroxy-6-metoxy-1,4-benzoquinol methylase
VSTTPPAPDEPIDDLASRLERERLDADRHYNDALTALDEAVRLGLPEVDFRHRLLLFLQTITGFVETKDRSLGGSELRNEIVRARARTLELQRAVEQLSTSGLAHPPATTGPSAHTSSRNVTGATYLGFEDQFRGSREEIRARLADYVPIFAGRSDVLDVGCGRGELLDLFRANGIGARGIDLNGAMVDACRARGLSADTADAVAYLESLPDASLGGLIAIQVVEHLEPPVLIRFLETAFLKMRPGAPLVLETINAACWMAYFETYMRDLTHARALHPDTLKFLAQSTGFSHADVRFRAPVLEADRLPRVGAPAEPALAALADALNAHADRLNARLFSSMDYALVARR